MDSNGRSVLRPCKKDEQSAGEAPNRYGISQPKR
ncbi:Uncharacterised protein [Vibrio cholerae]|nr:Uncharacterised protein [Vibrio cholerae]CSI31441.1 Uncharacterised protein [Vibrio cholerae]CSI52908.1 Uncharacterised protein [Vibrio cholerae]